MQEYICLKKNRFSLHNYSITPIRYEDIFRIKTWRNEQLNILRQNKILTDEDQEKYFRNFVSPLFAETNPSQLLFSFLLNNICIGYGGLVHISWEDLRAEMSFLVDPQRALNAELYRNDFSTFIELIKEVNFNELKFNRLFTETYEFREFHISILEQSGFRSEGIMRQHIHEKGKFYNSILHSILKEEYVKK